ncbi:MAG: glycosidase, partial [Flavobacteriaceae bacterium]
MKLNFPWQERPINSSDVIWRYSDNPIIKRDQIASSNSIFNSAVVPFKDGYAGVFRCDNRAVQMNIHSGFSPDGIHWEINPSPIVFKSDGSTEIFGDYKYDPRVVFIEDRYWITWCEGHNGPTIGVGYTFDFKEFFQCENAFLPFNRNGVLFPIKINGKYAMLSRPSDNGHTPFGDIYLSYSPDMKYWGEHKHVMSPTPFKDSAWQCTKVGAGSVPFLTQEGWL